MGILRPSMIKSCIIFIERLPDTSISPEKKKCILSALNKRIPMNAIYLDESLKKCPDCGAKFRKAHFCPNCGQRIQQKDCSYVENASKTS